MRRWSFGEVCEHGHLGRQCPHCELIDTETELEKCRAENAMLKAEAEELRGRLKATGKALEMAIIYWQEQAPLSGWEYKQVAAASDAVVQMGYRILHMGHAND